MSTNKTIRIGGASGFWGDSSVGAPQLVNSGQIDYLVFDYLAELTMSILAGARLKKPELGYATDFVTVAMRSVLKEVVAKGIRVVSNAGGVNPQGCADALRALADELGVAVKIAVVTGDDVLPLIPELRAAEPPVRELQSGAPLPARVLTANAYLGALPVKAALDAGAQIVITGRCVDSAVTLGVLMHAFDWSAHDYDRLAGGSLAGHIIECGCQATGGLHTDWQDVPDWAHIGYPIVECAADGSFVLTKPAGTGGLIAPQCVAEQMLYEIGDPAAYLLPDVVCVFTQVRIEAAGAERVRVHGARGRAPTSTYKVCATYVDGFKTSAQLSIIGFDAVAKARRTGEAILERVGGLLAAQGLPPFSATKLEVLGAEHAYGPHAEPAVRQTREAILRLTVRHPDKGDQPGTAEVTDDDAVDLDPRGGGPLQDDPHNGLRSRRRRSRRPATHDRGQKRPRGRHTRPRSRPRSGAGSPRGRPAWRACDRRRSSPRRRDRHPAPRHTPIRRRPWR